MASDEQIRESVERAKLLLKTNCNRTCKTSVPDLKAWFETYTPFEDSTLDDIILDPLLVIHELIEIEGVKKRGLKINKNTIVDNLEKVDIAHLEATKVELAVANSLRDRDHIVDRLADIRMWIGDDSVTPAQKRKYRRLLADAKKMAEVSTVPRDR